MNSLRAGLLVGVLGTGLFLHACVEPQGGGRGLGPGDPYDGPPYYGPTYGGPVYGTNEEFEREWEARQKMQYACETLPDRIRYDRQQIATIDPSKHHKALQWYKDDLANAERDRLRCGNYTDYGSYDTFQQQRRAAQQQRCAKIAERIRYDRQQIATIDPSKHHKALQWYKDDLVNAERDMQRCSR